MGQIIKEGNAFYEIDDECFQRLNKRKKEEERKKNMVKGQSEEKNRQRRRGK
ncbi:MAG TPA: hypothetical protein IAB31_02805 [Candidatus Choladousia intestinavium]|uniref:Uncharacterized protein n=1 Tax=Candidatus Choladousia intestinavium TaxID=2840727 RepID=A0A9D1D8X0_9FIRM|nr:hypothetical protein [Candidatus Choladousia intestinavium]